MKAQENNSQKANVKVSRTKRWLITGGVILLLGALLFVFGMSAVKWDFYTLDSTSYTEKTFAPDDGQTVTRVQLDVDSFPVEVTAGDAVSLTYYEASDSKVQVSCQDGVLNVQEKYSFNFLKNSWFNFGRLKRKYKLTVPEGMEVVIDGTNTDVELIGITAEDITIDATNADVVLRQCAFANLQIKSTNADVVLYNCAGGDVRVESTNLDLKMSSGAGFASLYARGTNIEAEIDSLSISAIELRGINADFEVKSVTVHTLTVHGTNLDAFISVVGEKSEYTVTTHGKSLPHEQTGTTDKKIDISGTNNDVELLFVR